MRLGWRGWSRILHRDIGYLAVGLTLVYAVSGLAVNHKAHWNPNNRTVREVRDLGPLDLKLSEDALVQEALRRLGRPADYRSHFQRDPETLELFLGERTCSIDLPTGKAVLEGVKPRPVLHTLNQMHLNEVRGRWFWLADAYALSLIVLALTGLVILRGRQGLAGRGKWLAGIGVVLPLLWWWLNRG